MLRACVNYTGRTSMEVGVRVEVEDRRTGRRTHTSTAYLTFVAVADDGEPTPIPPLVCRTDDEKRRYEEGKKRRAERLKALGKA